MRQITKLLFVILLVMITACGLDWSNPLDPANGDIRVPKLVTGIELSSSGQGATDKYIDITWSELSPSEADGYFIYRSRSFDGTFELIVELRGAEDNHYRDTDRIVTGAYFYKMSSFVYLDPSNPNDNERLEGPLNRPGQPGIVVPK